MNDEKTNEPVKSLVPQVARKPKALEVMANRLNLEKEKMYSMLKQTVFKGATDHEMMALVVVANEYRLNPMIKQIYAFPQKGGGIVPVVSVDGWVSVVNSKDDFDGCEFEMQWKKDGTPNSCTCVIYHKQRSKPVKVTEYYDECVRPSDPWKNMPRRMLRHKAYIQAARIAFGLSGIYDEDEARDIASGAIINVTAEPVKPAMIPGVTDEDPGESDAQPKQETSPAPKATKRKVTVRRKAMEQQAPPEDEPPLGEEPPPDEGSDTETTSPLRELVRLMVDGDVSDDQVLVICRQNEWDTSATSLEDLSHNTVLKLVMHWQKLLPELQSVQI